MVFSKDGVAGHCYSVFLRSSILRDFWYQVQFGHLPLDKDGQEDLYTLVVTVYRNGWYVLIYVLCMIALGYHLLHGFFSAARTLGVYHPRYVNWIRVGWMDLQRRHQRRFRARYRYTSILRYHSYARTQRYRRDH